MTPETAPLPTTTAGEAYTDAALHAWTRAGEAHGTVTRTLQIGDRAVRLTFAGDALVPAFLPALAHLPETTTEANATVHIWDAASTGVPLPDPAWGPEEYGPRGLVRGFNTDTLRTAYQIGSGVLSVADLASRRAIVAVHDAEALPYYERGAPLLSALHWTLSDATSQFVHAGAVGVSDGGVLLVGPGGSGKSTTALACLGSDLLYAGDDYALAQLTPDGPRVASVYTSAKIKPGGTRWLPHLRPLIDNPERGPDEKDLLFVHRHHPEAIVRGFPLRAIVVPEITGAPASVLQLTDAADAFRALVPSTVLQLPSGGPRATAVLARLVREVPCVRLRLGTDMAEIPHVIGNLLRDLA
ncbi:MAG: serine kinase [Bacteroidota bacterium]